LSVDSVDRDMRFVEDYRHILKRPVWPFGLVLDRFEAWALLLLYAIPILVRLIVQ